MLRVLISEGIQETVLELKLCGFAIFPSKAVVAELGWVLKKPRKALSRAGQGSVFWLRCGWAEGQQLLSAQAVHGLPCFALRNEEQTEANPASLHLLRHMSSSGFAVSTLQYLLCLAEVGRAWEALGQSLLSWYNDQNTVRLLKMLLIYNTTDFTNFYT